jgi:hypothetical protein
MSSSDRIRRNVGHFAHGVFLAVLVWIGIALVRVGNIGEAIVVGVTGVAIAWGVLSRDYKPGWEGELPPPSSRMRTLISAALWLGVGVFVAVPDLMLSPGTLTSPVPFWMTALSLLLFGSPALALTHLEFLREGSVEGKAKLRWGIERLGPVGAIAYFLTRMESGAVEQSDAADERRDL